MANVTCTISGCSTPHFAKGYCNMHYARARNGSDLHAPKRQQNRICSVAFCTRKHKAKGFCDPHYQQMKANARASDGISRARLKGRTCSLPGCEIKHEARGYCARHYSRFRKGVDLSAPAYAPGEWGPWYPTKAGYVTRRKIKDGFRTVQLQHRFVMEEYLGRALLSHETVHHKNGDRTDNSIDNLELWSSSQPAGQRVADKLAWAREITDLYG